MAQYHLRYLHHRMIPTIVAGATMTTTFVEKLSTILTTLLVLLLLLINWRFIRLRRGEKKLKINRSLQK